MEKEKEQFKRNHSWCTSILTLEPLRHIYVVLKNFVTESVMILILTAVLREGPVSSRSQRFQGHAAKRERESKKQKKQLRINLWPLDKQTILPLHTVPFPKRGARGIMIHGPGYANNTDTWPVCCVFHSTCSRNVGSTIKQGQFYSSSLFF